MNENQSAYDAYSHFLIIDLEATCCDRKTVPRDEMEIIEIGAVIVARNSLKPLAEFQTFIQPVRHPQLTPFCTELTSITQHDVETAPRFPEALDALLKWSESYDACLFCSWGDYDKSQFQQDCRYHGLAYPFGEAHLNLKKQFSKAQGSRKRFGMARALKLAGLSLEGTHHRGIDDARNMARLMPWILGEQKLPGHSKA
ncbi:3'-5' exonuclease [Gimesia panareensis]|uniref:3'-5' exonuclease n=1 Tax=Gimesia panareensis TaxID=2527978 RepID=UPI001189A58F|nr:3'-5' exonuclease [Gimesia panareensis]QDU48490.1 sporulation inhibitor KapD [Gimesia panareensis]